MLKTPTRETKALLDLADYFETLDPSLYDQSNYVECICGHCNARADRTRGDTKGAAKQLGLTKQQADSLFKASGGSKRWFDLPLPYTAPAPHDAARCLREIAVTGEIPSWW